MLTLDLEQGCEIRLGRIKSYGIRGRIHSYSHTTNTNTSTKNMERIRVDTRYDPVVFFPVVWIRGRIDTRSYGLVFLYKYNTNTTFFYQIRPRIRTRICNDEKRIVIIIKMFYFFRFRTRMES